MKLWPCIRWHEEKEGSFVISTTRLLSGWVVRGGNGGGSLCRLAEMSNFNIRELGRLRRENTRKLLCGRSNRLSSTGRMYDLGLCIVGFCYRFLLLSIIIIVFLIICTVLFGENVSMLNYRH